MTRNLSRFSKIIPPGNDQPNIVEEEAPSRLACQYCEMVCFCSSGKLHKKPYLNPRVSPHLRWNLIGAKSVADDVQKVTKRHKFSLRFSWQLPIVSRHPNSHLFNYSIIRVILNAEFDTVDKRPWQAHMAFLNMATLMFSFSMCLGLGLYTELCLFSVLRRLERWWTKKVFSTKKSQSSLCM